jgi:hypothetical protein
MLLLQIVRNYKAWVWGGLRLNNNHAKLHENWLFGSNVMVETPTLCSY